MAMPLLLASASPRRKEILTLLDIQMCIRDRRGFVGCHGERQRHRHPARLLVVQPFQPGQHRGSGLHVLPPPSAEHPAATLISVITISKTGAGKYCL